MYLSLYVFINVMYSCSVIVDSFICLLIVCVMPLSDIIHVHSGIRIAAILFLGIACYLIVYMSHRVNYLHGSNANLLYKYTYIGLRVNGRAVEGGGKSA